MMFGSTPSSLPSLNRGLSDTFSSLQSVNLLLPMFYNCISTVYDRPVEIEKYAME
jgi:hypothetical protein